MPLKLTDEELARQADIVSRLRETWEAVLSASAKALTEMETSIECVNDATHDYNRVITEANAFSETVAARLREELDGKDNSWLESPKGSAVEELINVWETAFEEIPILDLPQIDFPVASDAEELADRETEPTDD
jgi:hypothetical protein